MVVLPRVIPSIRAAGTLLRTGRITSEALVEQCLEVIADAQSGAFAALDEAAARRQARRLDSVLRRGTDLGPLHGIPIGIKDNIGTNGFPTKFGSVAYHDAAPADAGIVRRLRQLGAVVVGKTKLHEVAWGGTGINVHDRGVRNPVDPTRIAGGSSSGSAVCVADASCLFAVGTDTGGSIRLPAALCGVAGIKPTLGRFNTSGSMPVAPTLDHIGFIARSADDLGIVFGTLDRGAASSIRADRGASTIGVWQDWAAVTGSEVAAVFANMLDALRRAGRDVIEIALGSREEHYAVSSAIMAYEAFATHADRFKERPWNFGPDIRERLDAASRVTRSEYQEALQVRERLIVDVTKQLSSAQLVLSPTVPIVAPKLDELDASTVPRLVQFTRLFALIGFPAISIPAPDVPLPIGIQVAGLPGEDAAVLAEAIRLERLLRDTPD